MLALIVFLVVLSVLILAHELGHYLAAKKAGIKIEEFGLGYPPRIWGKKIGETIYSINLFPIGGFVRLYGEELQEKKKIRLDLGRAFWAKSKKVRVAVISAGVLANFLLAVVAFSIVYSWVGIPTKTDQIKIVGVAPNSPAAQAGLKENDIILKVNQKEVKDLDRFIGLIEERKGQEMTVFLRRDQEKLEVSMTPREAPPEEEGPLGVVVSNVEMIHYPFWQMPFRGAIEGFKEAFAWLTLVVKSFSQMFADLVTRGEVPKDIAGPIGILQITGGVAQSGFLAVLQFMGILSVNLTVINFLPFPALDGGRFLFVVYEAITRRRPKPEFERWINAAGMVILLFLFVLVAINDLVRFWQTSDLAARLRSSWPF